MSTFFSPGAELARESEPLEENHDQSDVRSLSEAALLCVDDDQAVLECEKAFLESFGHSVMTASSGREALDLIAVHSFDVVIVDYCMPEMNGQELAIAMRQVWPRAPIIMLSGTPDIPEQALKVVDTFVAKDCLVSKLLPAISLLKKEHSPEGRRQINSAIGAD